MHRKIGNEWNLQYSRNGLLYLQPYECYYSAQRLHLNRTLERHDVGDCIEKRAVISLCDYLLHRHPN